MDLGSSLRPNMRGITGFCDQETERDNRTNTQKEISQTHDSVRMTPQSKKKTTSVMMSNNVLLCSIYMTTVYTIL